MGKKMLIYLFRRRILLTFLIIIQFIVFGIIILQSVAYSIILETIFTLLSIGVALHVVWKKGKEAYKVTWILQVLIFPIYGTLFYLMFNRQTRTKKLQRSLENIYDLHKPYKLENKLVLNKAKSEFKNHGKLMHYLSNTGEYPVYSAREVTYYPLGEDYFKAMLEELKKAERYIFFEFFIVAEGKMWQEMLAVMEEKAAQGVDVRVMYDDIGSFVTLPKNIQAILAEKGITSRVYNLFHPIVTSSQNNRDHRKILSIDGEVAFTGGINVADEYINEIERFGHWKDNGVKLEGPGAWGLTLIFLQLWQTMDDHSLSDEIRDLKPNYNDEQEESAGFVQPFADSPTDTMNIGEHVFIKLIHAAEKSVWIYTPYLILDENLEIALILAARSGVDVRIVTPKKWDKYLVHITTRSYYTDLMDAGVKIYEYSKGFIHAKTILIDGEVAEVGTINFDYRSLYLHFENAVVIYGTNAIKEIEMDMVDTIDQSERIAYENVKQSLAAKAIRSVLRLFAPLM
ncbi:MAG: cardiolipin synthase [Alkalibacterium sp.]|uniref:cardiolipin synthase n=1 Tax=Alkalibacterium sp. TaxID=1872447 RepID=UPI00397085BF